jgi:hypothetical protein
MQPDPPTPIPPRRRQPRRAFVSALIAALLGVLLLVVPRLGPGLVPDIPLPSIDPSATTLLAVGDIGYCGGTQDEAVAKLAKSLPGTIALLGDIAYENGSASDYHHCFDPAWGPLLPRIRPAPGNHEYQTTDATGYFAEFGAGSGTPGGGWYSYDLGSWHVAVLNSNCVAVGGCGQGSPQLAWLKADLLAHPAACTLAYWHHPRYSSGRHGDNPLTAPLWAALAAAGADLVLEGHDHDYERFAPIDGMRSFVVGTGGRSLYELLRPPERASELRVNRSYGLLMLTLGTADYRWQFIPASGSSLSDAGTDVCH